ncbi:MAG: hypothetical protein IK073_07950 [Paludibacteraceae bacterium]|nr:hypothetical protein [Paludibacteraceae bacterium]
MALSHHHHHHHHRQSNNEPKRFKWKRDKKMIIGSSLIAITCIILIFGPFRPFFQETILLIKAWVAPEPDEPPLEYDPLKVNYKLRQERERTGDSVAASQNIDTMRREIRRQTVPVYRPPRKHDEWYLTEKDVKELRRGAKNDE